MKYLNVAEKNDAAKTIAGQLSNGTARRREGYSVYNKIYEFEATVKGSKSKMVMTSVSGHLLQLEFLASYRKWQCIDPQTLFEAPVRKACGENFEPIKRTLEREIRSCQGLIIWTDCDREGENIGFEIIEVCKAIKPSITVHRAIFSEITGAAVKRALNNLSVPDRRQSDAVDVRIELDLRTGAAITRFQTMRLQKLFPQKISDKLISYGSCQIPTLGFVVERYKEIEAFVSKPFWKIKVLHTIDDLTVEFHWARNRLFDKEACEDYYLLVVADPVAKVMSVTTKPKSKWRPQPMDTVELEKLGSRKLKMPAKQVMTVAEKLYTKGVISYPRTETNMFSKEIDLRALVEQQSGHDDWGGFAQRVLEWGPNPRNGSKSDQAHPPIHPTKLVKNLQGDEGRVYELVCRHFLACVSKDALGSETIVQIEIAGEKFSATGLVIHERNYLDVYIYDKWTAKQIHHYVEGTTFDPTEITMPEGATTAPPLLTEADLIALMEKNGIGTDATHAEHINTIKERGYIGTVDKGFLVPGVIGMGLYEGYDAMQLTLAKPVLRAEFENDLKKICLGQKNPASVLSEQIVKYKEAYRQIMEKITALDEMMASRINERPTSGHIQRPSNDDGVGGGGGGGPQDDDDDNDAGNGGGSRSVGGGNSRTVEDTENTNRWYEIFKCPKCRIAHLALKNKRNLSGYYIGCLNYPDCRNVIWLADECKDVKVLSETCRKCGPDSKLLSIRFTNNYYKTVFHVVVDDEGVSRYKTCLKCDETFRNTFQINLDCIKSMGPIIDMNSESNSVAPVVQASRSQTASKNSTFGSSATTAKDTKLASRKTKQGKETRQRKTQPKTKKKATSSSSSTSASSVRSYFSSAQNADDQLTSSDVAAAELHNIPFEMLFDDQDDDFESLNTRRDNSRPDSARRDFLCSNDDDDLLANLELDKIEQRQPEDTSSTNVLSSIRPSDQLFNDSLSRIYEAAHHDDLNDYEWGTAARREGNTRNNRNVRPGPFEPTGQSPAPKRGRLGNELSGVISASEDRSRIGCNQTVQSDHENVSNTDYSWGTVRYGNTDRIQPADEIGTTFDDDFSWGSDRQRVFLSRTENDFTRDSRQHSTIPNSSNNDYTWGRQQNHTSTSNTPCSVKCNGCNQPAKELIVKKEGPNKGRVFYVCQKEKPCKFFQWADELNEQSTQTERASQLRTAASSTVLPCTSSSAAEGSNPNCNCNEPAKCLTVRKEGPNKGREFYTCANREKSCGFFQWATADGGERQAAQEDANWGTGNNKKAASNATEKRSGAKSARKCGLCRQEGHSRQKCPRKDEFQF